MDLQWIYTNGLYWSSTLMRSLQMSCVLWVTPKVSRYNILIYVIITSCTKSEKWRLAGQQIVIVNQYKYLGTTLTPTLILKNHFEERIMKEKARLNSIWKSFMIYHIHGNCKCMFSVSVYNVLRCTDLGMEGLWGCGRYFLKKLFGLPQYTHTYLLYIETNLPPPFLYTLQLHFN